MHMLRHGPSWALCLKALSECWIIGEGRAHDDYCFRPAVLRFHPEYFGGPSRCWTMQGTRSTPQQCGSGILYCQELSRWLICLRSSTQNAFWYCKQSLCNRSIAADWINLIFRMENDLEGVLAKLGSELKKHRGGNLTFDPKATEGISALWSHLLSILNLYKDVFSHPISKILPKALEQLVEMKDKLKTANFIGFVDDQNPFFKPVSELMDLIRDSWVCLVAVAHFGSFNCPTFDPRPINLSILLTETGMKAGIQEVNAMASTVVYYESQDPMCVDARSK